jgi:Acetyltransferases, including N-acetylases of ribosomal proteins
MKCDAKIEGKYIYLESVSENDAQFILDIRSNPQNSKFIHKTDPSISKQRLWIRQQIDRKNDYYFIINTHAGNKIGTTSLYNIDDVKKEAEFGRWICNGSALHSLESAILIYDFAFYNLNLDKVYTMTVSQNKQVVSFHRRFGSQPVGEIRATDEDFIFYKQQIDKQLYERLRKTNIQLIGQFNGG